MAGRCSVILRYENKARHEQAAYPVRVTGGREEAPAPATRHASGHPLTTDLSGASANFRLCANSRLVARAVLPWISAVQGRMSDG